MTARGMVWAALCLAASGVPAATPGATKGVAHVDLICDAVYQPARSSWARSVRISYDDQRVRNVEIDGLPVFSFSVQGKTVLTALDNERIQIDLGTLAWTSDLRGLASAQGRCERLI